MEKSNPDPKLEYCVEHSYKLHPLLQKLVEVTSTHPTKTLVDVSAVIQTCTCFLKQINAKNVLDISTFTGFSALSWALALPENGRVITMDVQSDDFMRYGEKFIKEAFIPTTYQVKYAKEAGIAAKIDFSVKPVLETLEALIASGQSGQFDFAFLDTNKTEFSQYYEKSLQLLRSNGFIAIDNALRCGQVLTKEKDEIAKAIDDLNKKIASDSRVISILLPIGDGLHLAFKK